MNKTLRDKYIELVDEQAELEKTSGEQIASLRRTLIRVSLIGDGVDAELDGALDSFRDEVRANKTTSFLRELSAVENAVLAFDHRKSARQEKIIGIINSLCDGLTGVAPNREIKKRIKKFTKALPATLQKQYAINDVLSELSELQQLALQNSETKQVSLLQKFLGGKNNDSESFLEDDESNYSLDNPGSLDSSDQETSGKSNTVGLKEEGAEELRHDNKATPSHIGQKERDDSIANSELPIDFKAIAKRATEILQSLLDEVKPENCVEEKIINARERIINGLSWNDFVPTLEDIRDLIMQSNVEADKGFSNFLIQIDQELKTLSQLAKSATFSAQQQDAWQEHVESEVGTQLQSLTKEVGKADDLDDLKSTVNSRIKEIRSVIAKPSDKNDSAKTLANQVQALMSHVKKLESEAEKTKNTLAEEHEKARKDTLTGLPNREAYNEKSHEEYSRWRRYSNPLSMAVIDIDHFKQINDSYGHQVGDKVLKLLARETLKHLRDVDFVARYGGEEFVVLLPETTQQSALVALEKVRTGLADIPFHFNNKPVKITVSIGISEFGNGDTVDSVFARADKSLYSAKNNGRNQCVLDK
ncbi:MAG: GGDEF domain-containing protein [Cellvibrionaceae bacterium]